MLRVLNRNLNYNGYVGDVVKNMQTGETKQRLTFHLANSVTV